MVDIFAHSSGYYSFVHVAVPAFPFRSKAVSIIPVLARWAGISVPVERSARGIALCV